MTGQSSERNDHLSSHSVAAYLSGQCHDSERLRIEEHCHACAECREQMALVALALQPEPAMDQEKEFADLLRLGEQTANRVRREQLAARAEKKSELWQWLAGLRPALKFALAALAFVALAIPGWLLWRGNQPLERAMASLRAAWTINRPLEARVTGDFPYLPYQVTRSGSGTIPVNQDQLLAATAELAREVADKPSAQARHALGRLHLLKAEYARAEEQLNAAIKADPNNAQAYADLAAAMYERGTLEQSVLTLAQAAEHCEQATRLAPRLPEAWFNLALIHEQMMLLSKAKTDWEKYLELDSTSRWADEARARLQKLRERSAIQEPDLKKIADELLAADQTDNEAELTRLLAENFSEVTTLLSTRFLDEYLAARADRDQAKADKAYQLLHRVAQRLKETKGEHYFADLVAYVSRADDARIGKVREIRALLEEADTNLRGGSYAQAVATYWKARSLARQIGDVCHEETAMYGLARNYNLQTETSEMPALRKQLVAETARRHHQQLQVKALMSLVNQYWAEQLFSRGIEAGAQAWEIARRLGEIEFAMKALAEIGELSFLLGNADQAIRKNLSALQMMRQQAVSPLRACQVYTVISEILSLAGNNSSALSYQLESLEFCRRCNDVIYASAQGKAGLFYSLTGQDEQAADLLQKAISRAEQYRNTTGMWSLLGDLHLSLGDALAKMGQINEAEVIYRNTLNLIRPEHLWYLSVTHQGLATLLLRKGQIDAAEIELQISVELLERTRKNIVGAGERSSFSGKRLNVYRTMTDLQYSGRKAFDRAFDYAEIYRDRELLDTLTESAGPRWNQDQARLEYSASSVPLTLRQVQKSLPVGVRLVEYAITEQKLLIWVITADHWTTASVPVPAAQLQELVSNYLNELQTRRDLHSLNSAAKELSRLLLEPVAAHLNEQKTLVVVPDGALNAIPWAALISPASNRYLIEDHTLIVNPSASVTIHMLERGRAIRKSEAPSLLMVSNPKFDYAANPDLKALPATEQEFKRIQPLYPVSLNLNQEQATKRTLLRQMNGFEVIQLSTHSVINEQNSLLSSVILAADKHSAAAVTNSRPEQTEDNLRAHEIFRLRLPKTRLVILSSCRSVMTGMFRHHGTGGLAHAFFSAGAPTVIGSLWEVDDESSAELMTRFHHFFRQELKTASQALQQAQLKLLRSDVEKWRHPYYWAAFQLSGDGFTG